MTNHDFGSDRKITEALEGQGVWAPPVRIFDLDLFRELQEEYRARPIVPVARGLDDNALYLAAEKRVRHLVSKVGDLRGARVLEVGAGRGHVSRVLNDEYDCQTVGVDVVDSPSWLERPDLQFYCHDISSGENDFLGKFDLIISFAVWEHVVHPRAALAACRELLETSGKNYLYANLYRGPKASHRYREIFFPWPHLLFQDSVVADYYEQDLGRPGVAHSWVNKLTTAHYLQFFSELGFAVDNLWWSPENFDRQFYEEFEDILGRYPVFDLKKDFIYAVLKPANRAESLGDLTARLDDERKRLVRLERERFNARRVVRELEDSRSWRITAPIRRIRDR